MKREEVVNLWEGEDETDDIWTGEETGERTEDVRKVTGGTIGLWSQAFFLFSKNKHFFSTFWITLLSFRKQPIFVEPARALIVY
jgi:hypothetical protein